MAHKRAIMSLPVEDIVPEFLAVLRAGGNAVVQAPPGAGKSTLLPLKLLDQAWLDGGRILMLEPRRLAARMVARRLAQNLGQEVGRTVGFRVRDEARVGRETRLEVVTEGILTRLLQADPELPGVGAILFDEFHERSLQADLGLALALDVQQSLRPELRLVAMSATLDGQAVSALLGNAPILTSDGRLFPVETRYLPPSGGVAMEAAMAQAVRRAVRENEGDVLAFLPGAGEIRRVQRLLEEGALAADVLPLYGELPPAEQDRAVAPGGGRRVVLATSIAETSLTIEGVRVVVDAGLARKPVFDPRSGLTRLETVKASLASADQRRGRAGRLGPGVCYRLWAEAENRARPAADRPEIEAADLAALALDLAQWGVADPARLRWVNPPPPAHYAQAAELLRELEALDAQGRIAEHGRQLAKLPVHPRLAHMILRGRDIGAGGTACRIAALLEERDILRARPGTRAADIRLRLEALQALAQGRRFSHFELNLNEGAARRALRLASRLARLAGVDDGEGDANDAGLLLAFAYPDRIARRRPGGEPRYRLANGRGAALDAADALAGEKYIAVADLDGAGAEGRIFMAGALDEAALRQHFAAHIERRDTVEWDEQQQKVLAAQQERLGALVLSEKPLAKPSRAAIATALLQAVRQHGLGALAFDESVQTLRWRVAMLRRVFGEDWPDLSDAALLARLEEWLPVDQAGSLAALRQLDHAGALRNLLPWEQQRALDRLAPTHLEVPSGSRIRIDYADPAQPVLAVKLQEMFGLAQTPAIADGRVKLSLHLLSPAGRPLQVTGDLAGFWRSSYAEVRKEMRGRYPRHPWPEDPLAAPPTARAKRRGT
ncbi:MAG: ATP-dependent helicase HrpB [Reyranellaceae bacterium]